MSSVPFGDLYRCFDTDALVQWRTFRVTCHSLERAPWPNVRFALLASSSRDAMHLIGTRVETIIHEQETKKYITVSLSARYTAAGVCKLDKHELKDKNNTLTQILLSTWSPIICLFIFSYMRNHKGLQNAKRKKWKGFPERWMPKVINLTQKSRD